MSSVVQKVDSNVQYPSIGDNKLRYPMYKDLTGK